MRLDSSSGKSSYTFSDIYRVHSRKVAWSRVLAVRAACSNRRAFGWRTAGPYLLKLIKHSEFLESLSELGLILLLFVAGLETHMRDLSRVLNSAVRVGVLGLAFPFALGYAAGAAFGYPLAASLFIATASVATSVGITIRVLKDLGFQHRKSAKIILAAAVLDDILGLIILVIVMNVALGKVNFWELAVLSIEAVLFVAVIAYFGPRLVKKRQTFLSKLSCDFLFEISIALMLALSLLAEFIGLAAIVGAFLAGLVLSELREFTKIEDRFSSVSWFFVPFFFVLMGTYVDFSLFARPGLFFEVLVFSVVAILSKYIGAYIGALKEGKAIRSEVGIGMVPRGEVGIVVAGIALSAEAIGKDVYTSVIGMVILTTFVAPFLIKLVYSKGIGRQ